METNKLFIPTKCKVGLQIRDDTYTGKLGYIIYHDGKIWRKEKSWEDWRQKEGEFTTGWNQTKRVYTKTPITGVEPIEFDNKPTEGFVLNKKAGGESYGWNQRNTYCRVYDPRGWEFEISIENLLFILENSDSYKGKGLDGEFIYSWSGKDLVLLPTSSVDYQESIKFTENSHKSIKRTELVPGCVYLNSRYKKLVYVGRYKTYDYPNGSEFECKLDNARVNLRNENRRYSSSFYNNNRNVDYEKVIIKNVDVFYDIESTYSPFSFLSSLGTIKSKVDDEIFNGYSEIVEKYEKSADYSPISHYELIQFNNPSEIDSSVRVYSIEIGCNKILKESDITDLVKTQLTVSKNWGEDTYYSSRFYMKDTGNCKMTFEDVKKDYAYMVRVYENGKKIML